jgi:hypothetical protein
MKKIQIFNYQCGSCGFVFEAPSLSDFAYGEFILWSENGEGRYLNAFDDVVYQEVIDLVERQKKSISLNCEIQSIFGAVACDVDSKGSVFYIGSPPCPMCKSIDVNVQKIIDGNFMVIPHVTHSHWTSLSQDEKETLVLNACCPVVPSKLPK